MPRKALLCFALLSTAPGTAAAQDFRLGQNYSELVPTGSLAVAYVLATATDPQGDIYILTAPSEGNGFTYNLVKLSPGGDSVIYRNQFTAPGSTVFAVDPSGSVYLTVSIPNTSVEKLSPDGKTVEYMTNLGPNVTPNGLAVDASGRVYVIGDAGGNGLQATPGAMQQTPASLSDYSNAFVVRLKASGAVDYATYLGGSSQAALNGIAVDAAGSAFVTGFALSPGFPTTPGAYLTASGIPNPSGASFLVRLSPDGSSLSYSTFTDVQGYYSRCVAVDSAGNAVVSLENSNASPLVAISAVERFNPQGTAVLFSKALPASSPAGLAVDGAGNTYLAVNAGANFPLLNSIAPCAPSGTAALAVLDGNGNLLQSTYIAGSAGGVYSPVPVYEAALGVRPDSTVYWVGPPGPTYTATRQLAGSPGGSLFLTGLSQDPNAPVVQLACTANAASDDSTAMSGGEIVSLFGQGLGPAAGTQPQVNRETGFPDQLAGVQVTFNGTPGPLLYVQNNQINAIAPWVLQNQIGQTVNVCVLYNAVETNCITRPLVAEHPGVFTVDGVYAAALNQDGSINSATNPATGLVSIFATGLGPISPAPPDGAIVGLPLPVNVLQDGVYWVANLGFAGSLPNYTTVDYGGPAPYEVAGLSQVNFLPTGTGYLGIAGYPAGPAPYILQAGGSMTGLSIVPGSNAFFVH